jgi:hypothetical protein
LFIFNFDDPTIAKVFYQATGEGKTCVVDAPLWIFGRLTCGGDLLVVETIEWTIVAKSQCLGVVTARVKDPNEVATGGEGVMEWIWSTRWGRRDN